MVISKYILITLCMYVRIWPKRGLYVLAYKNLRWVFLNRDLDELSQGNTYVILDVQSKTLRPSLKVYN